MVESIAMFSNAWLWVDEVKKAIGTVDPIVRLMIIQIICGDLIFRLPASS
jgi:hypothetical protein